MRISQPPISRNSELDIDSDFDMGGLYQVGNLAVPAAGEVPRAGQGDIVNDDINAAAAIALSKLASIPGATVIRKTADQTVNNSTVLVNDNHLSLAVGVNEVWLLQLFLLVSNDDADSDFKMGWSYPVGCSIKWGVTQDRGGGITNHWIGNEITNPPVAILIETDTQAVTSAILTHGLILNAIVINGANDGDVNFQWAQRVARAFDTKVLTNSVLIAQHLA